MLEENRKHQKERKVEQKLNKLFSECVMELKKIGINILDVKQYGDIEITISKRNNKMKV